MDASYLGSECPQHITSSSSTGPLGLCLALAQSQPLSCFGTPLCGVSACWDRRGSVGVPFPRKTCHIYTAPTPECSLKISLAEMLLCSLTDIPPLISDLNPTRPRKDSPLSSFGLGSFGHPRGSTSSSSGGNQVQEPPQLCPLLLSATASASLNEMRWRCLQGTGLLTLHSLNPQQLPFSPQL